MDNAMYDALLRQLTEVAQKHEDATDVLMTLVETVEELRGLVREQRLINDRLTTLMERVVQDRRNDHED